MINEPITITDEATPYLEFIAKTKPDWMRKAMKSTGWMMQKAIKEGIRSGAPGGKKYSAFMPPTIRASFEAAFGGNVRRAYRNGGRSERDNWGFKSREQLINSGVKASTIGYNPLGKMSNAVGYQYDKSNQSVKVGWLSNSARELGKRIEAGYSKPITDPMRRTLFAGGIQLAKNKRVFDVKPRNTFGPMKQALQPKLVPYISNKIGEYALNGPARSGTLGRRYKVR